MPVPRANNPVPALDPNKRYLLSGATLADLLRRRVVADGRTITQRELADGTTVLTVPATSPAPFTVFVSGLKLYVQWGPVWTTMLWTEDSKVFPHRFLIIPSIGGGNLLGSPQGPPGTPPGYLELAPSKTYYVALRAVTSHGLGDDASGSYSRVGIYNAVGSTGWQAASAGTDHIVALDQSTLTTGTFDMIKPVFSGGQWWDHFLVATVITDATGNASIRQWHTGPIYGPVATFGTDIISTVAVPNYLGIAEDGGLYADIP